MSRHTDKQTASFYNPDNDTSSLDGTRTHLLISNGVESSDREYARVMNAQPYEWTEEEIQAALQENASRPFRLLR
jgi:hypothetical protein